MPLNSGLLLGDRRDLRLGVLHDLLGLVLETERLADHARLLLPRHAEVDELVGLRDGRRDLRQRLVVARAHAGVHSEQDVRPQGGDLLEVHLLLADGLGRRAAERRLSPGAALVVVAAEELALADRLDAEREHGVLLGVADRHHALWLGLDLGGPVLVLHRHGELAAPFLGARSGLALGVLAAAGGER